VQHLYSASYASLAGCCTIETVVCYMWSTHAHTHVQMHIRARIHRHSFDGILQPRYNACRYSAHSVIMLIGRWIPYKQWCYSSIISSY